MRTIRKFLSFLTIVILLGLAGWFLWNNEHGDLPVSEQIEQTYDIEQLPDYSGDPAVEINGGIPAFAEEEFKAEFFQKLSDLDSKGRCGVAFVCVDKQHMPEGEREEIDTIKPSGWAGGKYDFIDNGGFLFNRCHLIGWQLTGINAEERNLITGTRYFNVEGMLPYENRVAHYVRRTGNHVLYRVTPAFDGDELVARGVQMEALSVEDGGEGVSFNVFCYNVQPRVEIDYMTGENHLSESMTGAESDDAQKPEGGASDAEPADEKPADDEEAAGEEEVYTYVLNTNTMKFHYEYCPGVRDMKDKNKDTFRGTRSEVMEKGYSPCGRCTP